MIEFHSAADLRQHYSELRKRTAPWREPPRRPRSILIQDLAPEPEPIPVVILAPPPPSIPEPVLLPPGNAVMMHKIRLAVCRDFNVCREEFMSDRRWKRAALARHVGWYLASKLTTLSLPRIGHLCGGRDHTTVLYGIRRIKRLITTDNDLAAQLAGLEEELRG